MPGQRTMPRACETCGTQFLARVRAIRVGHGRFCSIACSAKAQSRAVKRICAGCGKTVIRQPAFANPGGKVYCRMACKVIPPEVRVWNFIDVRDLDECWPYTGQRDAEGYGKLRMPSPKGTQVTERAPRLVYRTVIGEIPTGFVICHACDNPPCCNPLHLFADTPAGNAADMVSKGRQARGNRNANARIGEQRIPDLRRRYSDGSATIAELAYECEVTWYAMKCALLGNTYAHIK